MRLCSFCTSQKIAFIFIELVLGQKTRFKSTCRIYRGKVFIFLFGIFIKPAQALLLSKPQHSFFPFFFPLVEFNKIPPQRLFLLSVVQKNLYYILTSVLLLTENAASSGCIYKINIYPSNTTSPPFLRELCVIRAKGYVNIR